MADASSWSPPAECQPSVFISVCGGASGAWRHRNGTIRTRADNSHFCVSVYFIGHSRDQTLYLFLAHGHGYAYRQHGYSGPYRSVVWVSTPTATPGAPPGQSSSSSMSCSIGSSATTAGAGAGAGAPVEEFARGKGTDVAPPIAGLGAARPEEAAEAAAAAAAAAA